ncbi:MAG: PCRF domain-containing protein, partial [Flavobacteriales bacterium]|nr:PCRF domain-containing protein [Flavobacteriales bacterium]
MINKEQVLKITERKDTLFKFLNIDSKEEELVKLEKEIIKSNFWDNPKDAERTLKNKKKIQIWVDAYNLIQNNIEELNILIELLADDDEINSQYKKAIDSLEEL